MAGVFLQSRGYVQRGMSSANRRRQTLHLSASGAATLVETRAASLRSDEKVVEIPGQDVIPAKANAEDKLMIEGQQRVIDATPEPKVMPTAHDRGVTLFNRLVEKIARPEQALAQSVA